MILKYFFQGLTLHCTHERDDFLAKSEGFNNTHVVDAHPVWQSIYIGLGQYENSLGIKYTDEVAFERVKEINPDVLPCFIWSDSRN